MNAPNRHIILLISGLLLCLVIDSLHSQSGISGLDKDLISFSKRNGLLNKDFCSSSALLGPLDNQLNRVVPQHLNGLTEDFTTHLSQNIYLFADTEKTDSLTIWAELGVRQKVTFSNLPINLNGVVRYNNGSLDWKRSTLSVNLDFQGFKENELNEFWVNKNPWEEMLGDNSFGLDTNEKDILVKEYLFTIYQKIVTSEKYKKLLADTLYVSEMSGILDPIANAKIGTNLMVELPDRDTLLMFEAQYQKYKKAVQALPYQEVLATRKRLDGIVTALQEEPLENKRTELSERMGAKVPNASKVLEQLQIGYSTIRTQEFVTTNLPVNGVQLTTFNAGIHTTFVYGKQAFSGFLLPSSGVRYLDDRLNNNILLSRIKWEGKQREVTVTGLRISDFSNAPERKKNGTNWVYGTTMINNVSDRISIGTSFYQSRYISEFAGGDVGQDNSDGKNIAFKADLNYDMNNKLSAGIGYFSAGPTYFSLADPFQLTNSRGIEFSLKGRMFKNRLAGDISFKTGRTIDTQSGSIDLLRYQARGQLMYQVDKRSFLRVSFMPNIYRLDNQEQSSGSQQGIFVAEYSTQNRITDEVDLISQLRISNFSQGFYLQDTARYTNQLLAEAIVGVKIGDKWNASINSMFDEQGQLSRLSLNTRVALKKIALGMSLFGGSLQSSIREEYGYSGHFSWRLAPNISFTTSATKINNSIDVENSPILGRSPWNWYGQASLITKIN